MNRIYGLSFTERVAAALDRARTKHPGKLRSPHEGYAVLLEEVDEVWDLVKTQKPDEQHKALFVAELVQVAAMAQRMAEDIFEG